MAKRCLLSAVILVSILIYIKIYIISSYLLEVEKAPAKTSLSPIKKVTHAPWSQSVWEMKNVSAMNEDRLRNIHKFCNKTGNWRRTFLKTGNAKIWEVKATDKRLNDEYFREGCTAKKDQNQSNLRNSFDR